MNIKILSLDAKDVDEFRQVEAECFDMKTYREMNYLMIPLINYGWCLKAVDDKKIVGGLIAFKTHHGRVYVNSLFVSSPYRKKGLARKMMNQFMDYWNGYQLMLEVDPNNDHAILLYKKLGFKKIRLMKNYFLDGEDRIMMATQEPIRL